MDLVEGARAAGLAGKSWHDWVMSDEVQDVIAAKEHFSRADQDAIEKAFNEGRREVSIARGRIVWTTAPSDYDMADATELEIVGDYFGKPLRKVAIDPEGYRDQTNRYASGTYGVWDNDPIEEDRLAREKYARQDAERAAVEAKHQAGIEWLRTASAEELADEDLCWEHGARHQDVREEKTRRREQEVGEKRAGDWARVSALIPEGATLIDEGAYIPAPMVGLRPIHRAANVYYDVRVVHGYPDDIEHAHLEHATGRRGRGSMALALSSALDLIGKGQLRVAAEGEVPPYPVVERIGADKWKDIRRVEVGGRVVWVGRATFGSEDLVLDAEGKLVRARKIADAAIAAAQTQSREGEGHARARGHHARRAGALTRRYGRSMTRGRVHVLGLSHDVTRCEHCGKKDLDSTVMLTIDGSRPVYVGTECARRLLKTG